MYAVKKRNGVKKAYGILKLYAVNAIVKTKDDIMEEENYEGILTVTYAMNILEKRGKRMSRMGIMEAAVRDRFKSKHIGTGKESFLLDAWEFRNWLQKLEVPDGFISIADAARKKRVSVTYIGIIRQKKNMETKKIGAGKGKYYINEKELDRIFEQSAFRKENAEIKRQKRIKRIEDARCN